MTEIFDTRLTIAGPFRAPLQMLTTQKYGGHMSIHDDATAEKLGFKGGPIEGPTHFSQFIPLLYRIWGKAWFETGCISAHYQNACIEGEEVKVFTELPGEEERLVRIWAEKKDGTPVLTGTASIGPDHPESELEKRIKSLKPATKLVILHDISVGDKGAQFEHVKMDFDQNMGALYPFTLNDKLKKITEPSPWYTAGGGPGSPWGKPIIPLEMVSVLTQCTSEQAKFPMRGPAIGLFADQEIKMVKGPLFVGKKYTLEREIIALSESRRTESCWIRTWVRDPESNETVAEIILNNATLKDTYANYDKEAQEL